MMLIEMKVKMGLFKCMESMVRDLRHPYIPSTTVLGDNTTQGKVKPQYSAMARKPSLNTCRSRGS